MSTISASTASNTAFKVTSDTTGTLVFQTGAVPTTAISIDASQVVSIGNIAVTGATTFAAGSAAAPSITTTGDTNTGIFFPAADTIAFTEGGTESMRIDSSGNVGIGTTPAVYAGYNTLAQNATTGSTFEQRVGGTLTGSLTADSQVTLKSLTAIPLVFGTNNTERARIDSSGNFGIGCTPSSFANFTYLSINGTTGSILNLRSNNTTQFEINTTGTLNNFSSITTLPFVWSINSAERMRLDSSGNLGLGVTPSAWDTSASRALQLNGGSVWGYSTSQLNLVQNAYYDGSNMKYISTAAASAYRQISGVHSWNIAASGTAGNTISFAEAMKLDASGNLYLASAGTGSRYLLINANNTYAGVFNLQAGEGSTGFGGGVVMYGHSHATYPGGVWIGRSNGSTGPIMFGSGGNGPGTEQARITSGGVLMVGTTGLPAGNGTAMSLAGSSAAARIYGTTDGTGALYVDKSTNTSTTAQVFVQFTINAQTIGSGQINANGASQAAFGSFSDRRLKDNIVDLASQWGSIKALRPVEFDYIASEGGGHQLGFIAQEVKEVYPDLVGERADKMLTLSGMGKNEARLIKALQEAMARIEQLEAKFAALEPK